MCIDGDGAGEASSPRGEVPLPGGGGPSECVSSPRPQCITWELVRNEESQLHHRPKNQNLHYCKFLGDLMLIKVWDIVTFKGVCVCCEST